MFVNGVEKTLVPGSPLMVGNGELVCFTSFLDPILSLHI